MPLMKLDVTERKQVCMCVSDLCELVEWGGGYMEKG